jgi:hypothetical protein
MLCVRSAECCVVRSAECLCCEEVFVYVARAEYIYRDARSTSGSGSSTCRKPGNKVRDTNTISRKTEVKIELVFVCFGVSSISI